MIRVVLTPKLSAKIGAVFELVEAAELQTHSADEDALTEKEQAWMYLQGLLGLTNPPVEPMQNRPNQLSWLYGSEAPVFSSDVAVNNHDDGFKVTSTNRLFRRNTVFIALLKIIANKFLLNGITSNKDVLPLRFVFNFFAGEILDRMPKSLQNPGIQIIAEQPFCKRSKVLKAGIIMEPGAFPTLLDRSSVLAAFGVTEHTMRFTSTYNFSSCRTVPSLLDDFLSVCSRTFPSPRIDQNRVIFNESVWLTLEDPMVNEHHRSSRGDGDHTHTKTARPKPKDLYLTVTYTLENESMGKKIIQLFKDQIDVG
ncbi:integrator complex subunit 11 [Clonorchis sinensis]|uniref:Integrator complex subunit 11 n=1 Tax=Clonorchis sinensis TaxID=79923 RepID=G7YFK0_CLOSI|nr:integrator complex subunit 11 [Clonorchis sinensis]